MRAMRKGAVSMPGGRNTRMAQWLDYRRSLTVASSLWKRHLRGAVRSETFRTGVARVGGGGLLTSGLRRHEHVHHADRTSWSFLLADKVVQTWLRPQAIITMQSYNSLASSIRAQRQSTTFELAQVARIVLEVLQPYHLFKGTVR